MLYPNGMRVHRPATVISGSLATSGAFYRQGIAGARYNVYVSETRDPTSGQFEGMAPNGSPTLPIVPGAMAARIAVATMAEGVCSLLQGGPMEGTASVAELTGTSGLSLVVGLEGTAAVATLTGNGMVLRLTVGLDGSGSWSLTGTPNLAMIVPFEGTGSVASMDGAGTDLKGLLALEGEWTPFSELSPESLAAAVWNSLVAQYGDAGTMGNALGLASSGGVDYSALAAAVLAAAQAAPIHADMRKTNGTALQGDGTESDKFRSELVP